MNSLVRSVEDDDEPGADTTGAASAFTIDEDPVDTEPVDEDDEDEEDVVIPSSRRSGAIPRHRQSGSLEANILPLLPGADSEEEEEEIAAIKRKSSKKTPDAMVIDDSEDDDDEMDLDDDLELLQPTAQYIRDKSTKKPLMEDEDEDELVQTSPFKARARARAQARVLRISSSSESNSDDDVYHTPQDAAVEDTSLHDPNRDELLPPSPVQNRRRKITSRSKSRNESTNTSRRSSVYVSEPAETIPKTTLAVVVKSSVRASDYLPFEDHDTVDMILEDLMERDDGSHFYRVEFQDGRKENIEVGILLTLENGEDALNEFYQGGNLSASISTSSQKHSSSSGSDNEPANDTRSRKQRRAQERDPYARRSGRARNVINYKELHMNLVDDDDNEDDILIGNRWHRKSTGNAASSSSKKANHGRSSRREIEQSRISTDIFSGSDDSNVRTQWKKKSKRTLLRSTSSSAKEANGRRQSRQSLEPTRRSERSRHTKSMKEKDLEEDLWADSEDDVPAVSKAKNVREIFQQVKKGTRFDTFHNNRCDSCGGEGSHSSKGTSQLLPCQGCSTSLHVACIGHRSSRDHIVTKIGIDNFVLQCRRCIASRSKKDAPNSTMCQVCRESSFSCRPFAPKKTPKQEEKLREENGGEDPITKVADNLINNADTLLFRCMSCHCGYHFEHLPPMDGEPSGNAEPNQIRDRRLDEYTPDWTCIECDDAPAKLEALVAWRLTDRAAYEKDTTAEDYGEDMKEYLVKWENASYQHCSWKPGAWVYGVTPPGTRKAFLRRDEGINLLPRWTEKQAIPDEYLRIEIVLDVVYKRGFRPRSLAEGKEQISEVERVYIKFIGLGYGDAVWDGPPSPDNVAHYSVFTAAYNEYLAGIYFKQRPAAKMRDSIEAFRSKNFGNNIETKEQPGAIAEGLKMMDYQMDGLNWLLHKYYKKENAILADEMGLGKTIQVISFLAVLIKQQPKCWPFLVVTPNSTCPNWRREIQKWIPGIRVVAFYGPKSGHDLIMKKELFPNGCKDMRAHIVVTSYEGPVEASTRGFFKRTNWAGMIVDEGQRLKNDENLLYGALKALATPFQVLLTGTPLQNNKRELFNLIQFLDSTKKAAELDEEFADLTKENLPVLHELIRPFFLRRTKLQVLKNLPPMVQVILPVTMSVLQKQLYKSILSKNPRLVDAIFAKSLPTLAVKDRGNLNNLLMQLRKVLAHPYMYSSAIEERSLDDEALNRNLISAASKFQLLNIMLPKLKERGHRVLIFSQFLDVLSLTEDLLGTLGMQYQRLDGSINSLEKQRRIDAFQAPDSPLFAFLLSTRAGGVGINLASADTVIIMDPDFNPHQDIQALSRAHRLGQKKKVLVFQLMTKDSAEEKIFQIGRKKIALDEALIESMGTHEDAGVDLEGILRHGAEALFQDDDKNDIHYDSASVDKLLDRTQLEDTSSSQGKTPESQFSYARVWANDKETLAEADTAEEEKDLDASTWNKILSHRLAESAAEQAKNAENWGRGQRNRQAVDYQKYVEDVFDEASSSPEKNPRKKRRITKGNSDAESDYEGKMSMSPDAASDRDTTIDSELQELLAQPESANRPSALAAPIERGNPDEMRAVAASTPRQAPPTGHSSVEQPIRTPVTANMPGHALPSGHPSSQQPRARPMDANTPRYPPQTITPSSQNLQMRSMGANIPGNMARTTIPSDPRVKRTPTASVDVVITTPRPTETQMKSWPPQGNALPGLDGHYENFRPRVTSEAVWERISGRRDDTDMDPHKPYHSTYDARSQPSAAGNHVVRPVYSSPYVPNSDGVLPTLHNQNSTATAVQVQPQGQSQGRSSQSVSSSSASSSVRKHCPKCNQAHRENRCKFLICNKCGIPHFAITSKCPSKCSTAQVRLLVDSFKTLPVKEETRQAVLQLLKGEIRRRTDLMNALL